MATKHRVFVSYHHKGNQLAVADFRTKFSETLEVFTDSSIERAADSTNVNYLARVCREAITGTSVTIVMVGRQTGGRKFVDWEIMDTLEKRHGLLGILLPGLDSNDAWIPDRLRDNINTGYAPYRYYPSTAADLRSMISDAYNADTTLIDNTRSRRSSNSSR